MGLGTQPVVFTGLTVAYLQGFPIDLTVIAVTAATLLAFAVTDKLLLKAGK